MKRLISILAAIAIMLSFSTIAFAADVTFVLEADAETYSAGDVIELAIGAGSTKMNAFRIDIKYDTNAISVAKEDGALLIGASGMTAMGVETVEKDYGFAVAGSAGSTKKVAVVAYLQIAENAYTGDYTITPVVSSPDTTIDGVEFTNITAEPITIHIDGVEPAGNKMVALVNTGAVETLNGDGWQKGQGIAATFNVADIKDFTAMNWVLTCNNIAAPKYAKVDNFAELIAAIGDESEVQFVATFVVNAIENEVETVYDITDVAAGFKPVEGEPVIFTAPAN